MSSKVLKQIFYSHSDLIEKNLRITKMLIYEDDSCGIEPCFNYQSCTNNVKIHLENNEFLHAAGVQFRPISIKHDFECRCPQGFTGRNSSVICDLEINLCYSNPCGQNGVCSSLESSFMCLCEHGYTGRFCEFNLNEMRCCDEDVVRTTTSIMPTTSSYGDLISNRTKSSTDVTCAAVESPVNSWMQPLVNSNHICKSNSRCKNLILGKCLFFKTF